MSLEYPCVYYKPGGLCEKYSTDGITSYCVQGPCPDQSLSNSDRIRAMDDEELAKWLMIAGICIRDFEDCQCDGVSCRQCRLNWLKQPAEEEP